MKKTIIPAIILLTLFSNSLSQPSWIQQSSPVITSLTSACAVTDQVCWICGPNNIVLKTVSGGTIWSLMNSGLPSSNSYYTIYALDENKCFVGTDNGKVYRTVNGGINWTLIDLTPTNFINVIHFFNSNEGFIMGDPAGGFWIYYITTDGGLNWIQGPNRPFAEGSEAGWNNGYAALDTGHIWWGTNAFKIWKGSFRGPFSASPTPEQNSVALAFKDINHGIVCFQTGPIMITSDGGVTWIAGTFTPNGAPSGLKSTGGWYWMSTQNYVYRSVNNGASWVSQLSLPAGNAGYTLTMPNVNRGWLGTQGGRIYLYYDVIGINNNQHHTPAKFTLSQNYPNPFNPTTYIDFELANTGYVTLKVYDMMGREVITLADGIYTAGNHNVIFNASEFSSGTYFYTMKSADPSSSSRLTDGQAGQSFTETKTMMLIK